MFSLQTIWQRANGFVLNMGPQDWAVVGVALVCIGFFALRGFGKNSRL